MMAKRLELWRLRNFHVDRLPSVEDVYLFRGVARDNPKDERLFALAEVRDVTAVRDGSGALVQIPHLERMLMETMNAIRREQLRRPPGDRLQWNRVLLYVRPTLDAAEGRARGARAADGRGGRGARPPEGGGAGEHPRRARACRATPCSASRSPPARRCRCSSARASAEPIRPLTDYAQKVVRMRQRGLTYPYELVRMLTPSSEATQGDLPPGRFVEHDLDAGRAARAGGPSLRAQHRERRRRPHHQRHRRSARRG